MPHDDDQHAAMVTFDVSGARGNRRPATVEFRTWGAPWTKLAPGEGRLDWATMPMVERESA